MNAGKERILKELTGNYFIELSDGRYITLSESEFCRFMEEATLLTTHILCSKEGR